MSDAKIKEGVFVGPQIRKLILNDMFDKTLNETELAAWKSFKQVCSNFRGLRKSNDFEDVVAYLLQLPKNGMQDVTQNSLSTFTFSIFS